MTGDRPGDPGGALKDDVPAYLPLHEEFCDIVDRQTQLCGAMLLLSQEFVRLNREYLAEWKRVTGSGKAGVMT